jgi:hypothetical protein
MVAEVQVFGQNGVVDVTALTEQRPLRSLRSEEGSPFSSNWPSPVRAQRAKAAFCISEVTSTGSRQTPIGTVTGMRAQRGTTQSATEKSDLGNQGDRDQGVGRRNPHDLDSCVMRERSPEERRLGSVLKVFAGSDLLRITFRRVLPSPSPFHHLKPL